MSARAGLAAPAFARVRTLVVGAVLALAFVATVAPGSAHASFFTFCTVVYLSGTSVPSDRCAHSTSRQYQFARAGSSFTTTKCAIVKTSSNGGGANATEPNCQYASGDLYSYCSVPYSCTGYPTVTNGGVATSWQYYGAANF